MSDEELFKKLMRVPKKIKLYNRNTDTEVELELPPLGLENGPKLRKLFSALSKFVGKMPKDGSELKLDIEFDDETNKLIDELIIATLAKGYPGWSKELKDEVAFVYRAPLTMVIIDINAPYNPDKKLLDKIKKLQEKRLKDEVD